MTTNLTLGIATALAVACSAGLAGDEITKTNLQATVTINVSTNVVSGDNASGCAICTANGPNFVPAVMNHVPCAPYKAATERWTITNVVKRVTLTVDWNGKPLRHAEETVLHSSTNRFKLHSEWKQD